MTRSEDLTTLGLSSTDDNADDRLTRLRKAYLKLSKTYHPDKGGSKEAFQELLASYHRLNEERYVEVDLDRDNESDDESDDESTNNNDDQSYYSYEDYYNYFNTYGYYNEEDDFDAYEDNFSSWEKEREARRRAYSEFHKQQVKRGNDFRDGKASTQSDTCMFCGENAAITESSAEENGINWEEYIESAADRTLLLRATTLSSLF